MIIQTVVLWVVTSYSLIDEYQRSGGTYCLPLRLQGHTVSQPSESQSEPG
jgi:hypothetical protein